MRNYNLGVEDDMTISLIWEDLDSIKVISLIRDDLGSIMFTSCRLVVLRMLLGVSANSDSSSPIPSFTVFASGVSVGKSSLFVVST